MKRFASREVVDFATKISAYFPDDLPQINSLQRVAPCSAALGLRDPQI
jgi:hypothetical protein